MMDSPPSRRAPAPPSRPAPPARRAPSPSDSPRREIKTKVVGVTRRNRDGTDRQTIIRRCVAGEPLALIPAPDNPHDEDAIMICRRTGEQLGYVSEDLADTIGDLIADGHRLDAEILTITGGTADKPTRGVNLRILVNSVNSTDR